MILIIAGGREYRFTTHDRTRLNLIEDVEEVVSGGARGADSEGEAWAAFHKIPVRRFLPDWDSYGKRAGMLRNRDMAEYADAVALFPGGAGTQNMFECAKKRGLLIFDFRQPSLF